MNIGTGTVAAQFLLWEYLFRIFRYCVFAVCTVQSFLFQRIPWSFRPCRLSLQNCWPLLGLVKVFSLFFRCLLSFVCLETFLLLSHFPFVVLAFLPVPFYSFIKIVFISYLKIIFKDLLSNAILTFFQLFSRLASFSTELEDMVSEREHRWGHGGLHNSQETLFVSVAFPNSQESDILKGSSGNSFGFKVLKLWKGFLTPKIAQEPFIFLPDDLQHLRVYLRPFWKPKMYKWLSSDFPDALHFAKLLPKASVCLESKILRDSPGGVKWTQETQCHPFSLSDALQCPWASPQPLFFYSAERPISQPKKCS